MEMVDAVVVGAGVVGLAVGRALALAGMETLVLERFGAVGTATSARSSEVIHAGLYYQTGSLKARLCSAGRERLYAYCDARGVAHRRCGKLLVATADAERAKLRAIQAQALRNGVTDLRWLEARELRALEPELAGVAALLSPSTGILDSHAFMLALQGDLEREGGAVVLRSPVLAIRRGGEPTSLHHVLVGQESGAEPIQLAARVVVNAAGLWATGLAEVTEALAPCHIPRSHYAKGSYFDLAVPAPFRHLVYPVPPEAGLGVHLTLDLAGRARFGPDVEWIAPPSPDAIDYRVDPARASGMEGDIRRYWPGLVAAALRPAYSGVRPKLQGPGEPAQDFMVQGPAEHGVAGLVNLFGIESPGLTASLAIADEVLSRLALPRRPCRHP